MRDSGLGSLLGLDTRPFRWERAFLFGAALVVCDVILFGLGFSQSYSPEGGFTISFFRIDSPWELAASVVADALRVAVVVLMLGLVRREGWALVLAALIYALVIQPIMYVRVGVAFHAWSEAVWPIRRILSSAVWTLGFFGCLALALRAIRRPLTAVVVGGVAGNLVATTAASATGVLARAPADWPITLGFFLRGLPQDVLAGALFGLLLWAGLAAAGSFREEPPQAFVGRSFFTGMFVAGNAVTLALGFAAQLFILLGVWGRRTGGENFSQMSPRTQALGLLVLGVVVLIITVGLSIVFLRFIYRLWTAVQDGHARMTPGQAVGFLFIPFFGFYWVFQVWAGFASDFNAMVRRRGLALPALRPGLFVAFLLLALIGAVPYLEIAAIAAAILGTVLVGRICDGVNGLAVAGAAT